MAKITRKKFKIYYYTLLGFSIEEKFANSIGELILSEKIKKGLSSITEFEFNPIQKEYIEVAEYDNEAIESKPKLKETIN